MSFESLGLDAAILKAVADQGYTEPTPIQKATIPVILEGTDVIGIAQTGTGKTAAFTLPLITKLLRTKSGAHRGLVRCLILAPTRELVVQIAENVNAYSRYAGLSVATCYGGVGERPQIAALRAGCDILVATPGRLLDLGRQGHGNFGALEYLVLDEADRMLDMGFLPAIKTIVRALPKERQTLLFSATLSREIEALTSQFQRSPKILEIGRRSNPAETVTQLLFECPGALKQVMLHHLLANPELKMETVLVFARTKHGADRICRKLAGADIPCAAIHANRSQSQRQRALQAFKNGEVRVLVATDIASRGIDVDGISHVVNFDFPDALEDYVHRIGRTGRALATGTAITFITREDYSELRRLERIVGKHLHCGKLPGFDYTQQAPARTPEDFQRDVDPRARGGRPQHSQEGHQHPQGGRFGGQQAAQGRYRPFGRPGTRRQGGPR
jgi:ATP-dependent RNA helicase RhlE